MSPVVQGTADPDQEGWLWLHLETFASGIIDQSFVSKDDPVLTAPLGSAQAQHTWSCAALHTGGLGPLPAGGVTDYGNPGLPGGASVAYIVGMAVTPNLVGLDGGAKREIVMLIEAEDESTHYLRGYSVDGTNGDRTIILTKTSAAFGSFFGCPFPSYTRARTTTPTLLAGLPILVFPSSYTGGSGTGQLWVYPSPTTRTAFTVKTILTPTSGTIGRVVTYLNRILCLAAVVYTWPGGGIVTSEQIHYTTPPNSYTYLDQRTVLAPEDPFGFGAAGSISTGELLLVKQQGGGVVLNGDIYDPYSILYLPGVQPTGRIYGHACGTALGLFYCASSEGAWLWNGGNTSSKVSSQIRDDFYDCTSQINFVTGNLGWYAERWGKLVLFSNNWVYDTQTQSWWRLFPTNPTQTPARTDGTPLFWFCPDPDGTVFWAAPISYDATSNNRWIYHFTATNGAYHWQWTSTPIHVVATANHVVDVREIVVRASAPDGEGTLSVKIDPFGTTPFSATVEVTSTQITQFRLHVGIGALGLDDIVIQLHADSSDTTHSAPLVHSIDIGYNVRAHVEAQN